MLGRVSCACVVPCAVVSCACVFQVVYHVVTMIPNQLHLYRNYQNKKRHIGNDNVNIVYSDSPKEFKQDTIQVRC